MLRLRHFCGSQRSQRDGSFDLFFMAKIGWALWFRRKLIFFTYYFLHIVIIGRVLTAFFPVYFLLNAFLDRHL